MINDINTTNPQTTTEPAIGYMPCCVQPLLISFSAGRTSAFMCKFLLEHPAYKDRQKLIVFANTGKELEETLIFADKCDKELGLNLVWIEAVINPEKGKGTGYKIVDFETASRKGEPFKDLIAKYGLPSKLYRHCTRELKEIPIHKFAREILGSKYETAIGIRADEKHRLKEKPGYVYPLAELNVDEKFIRNWWDKQCFDLNLKDYEGNCDLCFLKSKRKKLTLVSERPEIANWWDEMEEQYASEYQSKFDEIRNLSIKDIILLAELPFQKAIDKQELRSNQLTLFNYDSEYDLEYDCFCKNS